MRRFNSVFAAALVTAMLMGSTIHASGGTSTLQSRENAYKSSLNMMEEAGKASPDSLPVPLPSTETEKEKLSLIEDKAIGEQIIVEVNGIESNRITFYMKRDPYTNQVTLPEPVTITIRQTEGQAIGSISTKISPILNQDRERIRIEAIGNTNLSPDTPVQFSISFVDQNIGDEADRPSGSSKNFYIQIISDEQDSVIKTLSVFYGADGFYTRYSAEYIDYYKGPIINGKYVNVGEIDLKQQTVPTFTIEHYYKPMTGTDSVAISEIQLNPDGMFTFTDGSTTMSVSLMEEGWLQIPVKMKPESFEAKKNEAISKGQTINLYTVFDDLLIIYDDGYMAGGTMNPLPLVYHIIYRSSSSSSGGSGGSGGGGGGSSGGSGGGGGSSSSSSNSTGGPGGTGTVTGPTQTVRTTIATQNDIGWITVDGQRYYMNADNQPVTDWLKWTDGKWYYFGSDGIMKIGWTLVDGKWYLLNQDGSMVTGLVTINYQWYLLKQDGSMATGWEQDPDGNWRFFADNGIMMTNYTTPDGKYIGADGIWRG